MASLIGRNHLLTVPSPLVRVPADLRNQVSTICRLYRQGRPAKAALEQAIAALQSEDSLVSSRPNSSALDSLIKRVEALEMLTALLASNQASVSREVNRNETAKNSPVIKPVNHSDQAVNSGSSYTWLTVEEAWAIAVEKGCPASLGTFRRWARGNAKYPDGDEATLRLWGFTRDLSRATTGHPKNPARFLRAIAD